MVSSHDDLWKKSLSSIEVSISKANFSTWFKNTKILSIKDNIVTIGVPNGFAKEWLENKYHTYIVNALRDQDKTISSISCSIYNPLAPEKAPESTLEMQPTAKHDVGHENSVKPTLSPLQNSNNLNTRYTFDNFVVGEHNELAKAACVAVSENLGKIYNPLFIYGHVGLGKTHLLQSIGNMVASKDPHKKIIYTTAEKFMNELIESIKNNTASHFKKVYQSIDLLIIDDVQFLSGKEKTQQEFFHIFNALYQLDKQIVISSDRPPKSITTLEERLRSRFEGGMIVDVSTPNLETRIAILKEKALVKNFHIEDDVLRFIAENIKNNIRELEGALNRVIAFCDLQKKEPTQEFVATALSELIASSKRKGIQIKDVIDVISSYYEVEKEELLNKGRKKEVVYPRQIAMYLLRTELNTSYPGIGKYFGGRDHTTALHAYEKINKLQKTNKKFSDELSFIQEKLYNV